MTDGGSVFISEEFRKFADDMGFKLIRSSPYYAQASGQAEASNQSLKNKYPLQDNACKNVTPGL